MLHRFEHPHGLPEEASFAAQEQQFPAKDTAGRPEFVGQNLVLKTKVSELAVHGGVPVFAEPLHVGRPNIPNKERLLEQISNILDRAWLTNDGPCVREFERRVADVADVQHCIATSSGTTALEIAAAALDLTGEVIVPALTFIATPHAFGWRGLTPIFADIDPITCCISPAHVEELITPKTSAIVGVHLWGQPCDTDALSQIAGRHGLKLLFDSSHAFGCSHQQTMIGGFGDAEIFSFHATKFVAAGEGGAVVTNSHSLANRLRGVRNFGFTAVDQVGMIGTNAKLNEISAAFGISSLDEMDAVVAANRRTREAYADMLSAIPGIRIRDFDNHEKHNYQYVVAHIDEGVTGVSRDQILHVLDAENVLARRYFYPGCHRSQPYGSVDSPCSILPVTDRVAGEVLCLPGGRTVSSAAVAAIGRIIELAIQSASTDSSASRRTRRRSEATSH